MDMWTHAASHGIVADAASFALSLPSLSRPTRRMHVLFPSVVSCCYAESLMLCRTQRPPIVPAWLGTGAGGGSGRDTVTFQGTASELPRMPAAAPGPTVTRALTQRRGGGADLTS